MDTMNLVPAAVIELLAKKYHIMDIMSFLEFDHDFDILRARLAKHRKAHYDQFDRILVQHGDTDFYFQHCSVGVNLLNFFNIVDYVDIPRFVFLFYTNHHGLGQEIRRICLDPNDQPTVIESVINNLSYSPDGYEDQDAAVTEISHNALCMLNLTRSHRVAMHHVMKSLPDDKVLKSVTVKTDA